MATLKDFLSELAISPQKLGKFIHQPDKTMKAAGLSDEDQSALKSGFAALIFARLSGVPIKEAFVMAFPVQTPAFPPTFANFVGLAYENKPTILAPQLEEFQQAPQYYPVWTQYQPPPAKYPSPHQYQWSQQAYPYYAMYAPPQFFPPPYWWGR